MVGCRPAQFGSQTGQSVSKCLQRKVLQVVRQAAESNGAILGPALLAALLLLLLLLTAAADLSTRSSAQALSSIVTTRASLSTETPDLCWVLPHKAMA